MVKTLKKIWQWVVKDRPITEADMELQIAMCGTKAHERYKMRKLEKRVGELEDALEKMKVEVTFNKTAL